MQTFEIGNIVTIKAYDTSQTPVPIYVLISGENSDGHTFRFGKNTYMLNQDEVATPIRAHMPNQILGGFVYRGAQIGDVWNVTEIAENGGFTYRGMVVIEDTPFTVETFDWYDSREDFINSQPVWQKIGLIR
jgi:hypothetical protein